MLWSMDERPKIIAELGKVAVTTVAKELGKRWETINPQIKTRYEELAKEEKEKYINFMKEYKPTEVFLKKMENAKMKSQIMTPFKKMKKVKDLNAPKRPLRYSFTFFC